MKSNQTKFTKTLLLTTPVVRSIVTGKLTLNRGQWVETWGGYVCQYSDHKKSGVILEKKTRNQSDIIFVRVEPESINLPLFALASGVLLLLLTLIS